MASRLPLVVLAATVLLSAAAPLAAATSVGFCIVGICEGVQVFPPVDPGGSCTVALVPPIPVANIPPGAILLVRVCPARYG
jgi:hypothetical protein